MSMLSDELQGQVTSLAKTLTPKAIRGIEKLLGYIVKTVNDALPEANALMLETANGWTEALRGDDYGLDFTDMTQEAKESHAAAIKALASKDEFNVDLEVVISSAEDIPEELKEANPLRVNAIPERYNMGDLERIYTAKAAEINAARVDSLKIGRPEPSL